MPSTCKIEQHYIQKACTAIILEYYTRIMKIPLSKIFWQKAAPENLTHISYNKTEKARVLTCALEKLALI